MLGKDNVETRLPLAFRGISTQGKAVTVDIYSRRGFYASQIDPEVYRPSEATSRSLLNRNESTNG